MVQATVSWAALPSWPEMGKPGSSETRAGAASVVGKLVAAVDGRARACLVAISDQLGFPSLILWGGGGGGVQSVALNPSADKETETQCWRSPRLHHTPTRDPRNPRVKHS